ncbi:MAG: MFS transporter [Chloroflexi bacterium]|nr:MFS transporter [Chloroflexota bacterium]MCI0867934.1 MFS transporter [Chloroflexota bacterium]
MIGISRRVYYGWFIVAAAGSMEFANAASAISILTIFVNPMAEEFNWSRTEISGATSLGAILGASLAPFTGRLVDRVGSRWPLALGGVAVALACVYLSAMQTLLGFYIAFTVSRTADQGLIKIGAVPAVGKWFERYRGRAVALVFFGGSAGIVVLAPVVQIVMVTWGWRAAWLVLGAVMLALGVIPSFLIVRRQPEDLGLAVDGRPALDSVDQNTPGQSTPLAAGSTAGSPEAGVEWPLARAVRTPAFWLVLVSLFVASTSSAGVTLHLVPYLTQQGLGAGAAVSVISVLSISSALGILALGFLAERVSPRILLAAVFSLIAVAIGVLLSADSLAKAYAFAVLHGLASGGMNTLAPLLWASYYGRGILGSLHGISRAAQVAGFALGPLVLGIAYDASGTYQTALVYFAFTGVASSLLILAARRPRMAPSRRH